MIVAVHAGAGSLGSDLLERAPEVQAVLTDLLLAARDSLRAGIDAIEIAVAAVVAMESYEAFNAGIGAALCADGTVELSAAAMRGADRTAGAVAGVRTIRHPIQAARVVLELEPVLVIGEAAERIAAEAGVESWLNDRFITERQRRRWVAGATDDRGTVGAVCLDGHGRLAAATSTGGIRGQIRGRVGDSPLIGAGTWADRRVAVSCTGDGECFIRAGAARTLAIAVAGGEAVGPAGDAVLADVGTLGGAGGLIALGADGTVALPFSTGAMPRGFCRADEEPMVWVT